MKSKQLANVLIKIVGLYVCLVAIPYMVSGIGAALSMAIAHKSNDLDFEIFSDGGGALVQMIVGTILIVKSRKIAEFWFKNEEE
jgi:hypothetical protein